ncbi:hypothetical protein CSUI_005082 [Cystoisospora suis]|uniref:Uncharacterized protein n=1 Tax=Cystoisospora suis TaxID=483139 RepID=A0A2C6KWF8_9APIC|nr:hypothetical protein CSUI_005082 [Cystoisospora suis]
MIEKEPKKASCENKRKKRKAKLPVTFPSFSFCLSSYMSSSVVYVFILEGSRMRGRQHTSKEAERLREPSKKVSFSRATTAKLPPKVRRQKRLKSSV